MKPELRISCPLAILTALAIAGCEANHYEIEMTPTGETVRRELTCWRGRTVNQESETVAFPAEELARIAAAYDASTPGEQTGKHKFANVFSGELPNDVGGSGSYTHWNTSLGSVSAYVERARGNDDLLADVESRQQAADRIADLLSGWLASELEGEAGFAELHEFLENRLRRDVKNLSLYSWAFGIIVQDHEDADQPEWLVRAGQYLVERSYFTPEQLPTLARAVEEASRNRPESLLAIIQRFTASKMAIAEDQPIPASLKFLADVAALESSINDYLRRTDEFQCLLEAWKHEKATNPEAEAEEPEPFAVMGELVIQAFLPAIQGSRGDQLKVKLAVTSEPFQTNGQWDANTRHVGWSRDILAADSDYSGFPTLMYAVWSSPDLPAQQEHFGRLVLADSALSKYCLWYRGLSPQEVKEWDTFVASLRSNDDPAERLRAFRFSHEPPAREGETAESDLAATPRELILSALTDQAAAN